MQKQLMKIMQLRYWKYLVGLQVMSGTNTVNDWHREYNFTHSKKFIKVFKKHPEYYIFQDTSKHKVTKSLTQYQKEKNQLFKAAPKIGFMINSMLTVLTIMVIFGAGLMTFVNDWRTNFDTFLFSLSSSRRQIYWTKLLYSIGTILSGLVVGKIVNYLIIKVGVKASYVQFDMANLVQQGVSFVIIMIGIYTVGCLIGLVIGKLPILIFGGFGLLLSSTYAIDSMSDTRRFLMTHGVNSTAVKINTSGNNYLLTRLLAINNNHQRLYQNNQQIAFIVGFLIITVLLLLGGAWIYKRLSLENKYQLVQINSLKKPVVIIGTLYLAWLLGMNGFFSQQPFELIYHHQKIVLLWIFLRNIVVIGIIGWVFVERPWQKKDTFKWFKK